MNALEGPKPAPIRAQPARQGQSSAGGFPLGLGAYALWGVLPIYFKALADVSPGDIVAHRVLWSLPYLGLLITASKGWPKVRATMRIPRTIGMLSLTALLIGTNWLLYTYAVTSGHILAASFGYYLNPLANVLLGRFVLGERLSRLQWTAVAIAAAVNSSSGVVDTIPANNSRIDRVSLPPMIAAPCEWRQANHISAGAKRMMVSIASPVTASAGTTFRSSP